MFKKKQLLLAKLTSESMDEYETESVKENIRPLIQDLFNEFGTVFTSLESMYDINIHDIKRFRNIAYIIKTTVKATIGDDNYIVSDENDGSMISFYRCFPNTFSIMQTHADTCDLPINSVYNLDRLACFLGETIGDSISLKMFKVEKIINSTLKNGLTIIGDNHESYIFANKQSKDLRRVVELLDGVQIINYVVQYDNGLFAYLKAKDQNVSCMQFLNVNNDFHVSALGSWAYLKKAETKYNDLDIDNDETYF